jgi:hypothetical protein
MSKPGPVVTGRFAKIGDGYKKFLLIDLGQSIQTGNSVEDKSNITVTFIFFDCGLN